MHNHRGDYAPASLKDKDSKWHHFWCLEVFIALMMLSVVVCVLFAVGAVSYMSLDSIEQFLDVLWVKALLEDAMLAITVGLCVIGIAWTLLGAFILFVDCGREDTRDMSDAPGYNR